MTNAKSRKALKISLIIVLSLVMLISAVFIGFIVKGKIQVKKLEKLSMDDSLSAKYSGYLPDADTIYSYAQDLFDMGARRPGTDAGAKAQAYVKDRFTEFGLPNVDIIPSKTKLYTCDEYSLSIAGKSFDCCFINYSACNGQFADFDTGDITAEMVYIGSDTDKNVDVTGKIVVADVGFQSIPYVPKARPVMWTDCNRWASALRCAPYISSTSTENWDFCIIRETFS